MVILDLIYLSIFRHKYFLPRVNLRALLVITRVMRRFVNFLLVYLSIKYEYESVIHSSISLNDLISDCNMNHRIIERDSKWRRPLWE